MNTIKFVKARKTLTSQSGEQNFTKGSIYPIVRPTESLADHTSVKDDQNDDHLLGNWKQWFSPCDEMGNKL